MISNPTSALEVSKAAEHFLSVLESAFESARSTATPDEFARLKHVVGVVVGTLEVDLLWPLYKQHPDLEPVSLRGLDGSLK